MSNLSRSNEREFYRSLTIEEKKAIILALKDSDPWEVDNTYIKNVKDEIKKFHLEQQDNRCCYCYSLLTDRNIETDREHIIPKSKNKKLSYNIFNLSVSCKRCNISYKKDTCKHIVDLDCLIRKFRDGSNYNIPHPNIDHYTDHISLFTITNSEINLYINLYKAKTEKGQNLYTMFSLDKLCENNLDKCQGIENDNLYLLYHAISNHIG